MSEVPVGWYEEVVGLLREIRERLRGGGEVVPMELPASAEPLPTWILTDAVVARVEESIEGEQRVRGQAYGG